VESHEAYRAHIEAKEAARAAEASNWEIKRQTLAAEHQLALRQVEAEKNSRIAQLERELSKVKDELNDAMEEIESLSAELGGGGGGGGRAQSYQPEPIAVTPKPGSRISSPTASYAVSPPAPPPIATPAAEAAPSSEPAVGTVEEGQF
jgi:cell division septation protein DedD